MFDRLPPAAALGYVVLASITFPQVDRVAAILPYGARVVASARDTEPRCLFYGNLIPVELSEVVVAALEVYVDSAAFAVHRQSPALREMLGQMRALRGRLRVIPATVVKGSLALRHEPEKAKARL